MKTPKSVQASIHWLSLTASKTVADERTLEALSKALWPSWQDHQEQVFIWEQITIDGRASSWHTTARFGICCFGTAKQVLQLLRSSHFDTQRSQIRYRLMWQVGDRDGHFCFIDCETHRVTAGAKWPHPVPRHFQVEPSKLQEAA